jgi:Kef-type K+ transport system membrane component KefB
LRRTIILGLLFGGMRLILPLGVGGRGSQALLTFGFLILAAYTTGELAVSLRLPRIVGYLLAGAIFGPSVLNTVTVDAVERLAPVSSLAIALIAFLAGAELRWQEVRERGRTILRILVSELGLTFLCILGLLLLLREYVPFLRGTPLPTTLAFGVLFAAIAVVHSPAVTMALLSETGARGPVARTTLGVVLVSDVVVVLLFSGALALAQALVPPTGTDAPTISALKVGWEIGGAVVVGAALGAVIALYLRFVRRELALFAILVAFFGAEIAALAHTETLLTLLAAGFVAENLSVEEHGAALRHAMERSAAPVFVVFFALAGADIALADVAAVWVLLVPIVAVRMLGIWAGSWLGARWAGVHRAEGRWVWMGLISQAGVAIGLARVVSEVYPNRGSQLSALFLAVLAINQTLGPILFRIALARSGELLPAAESAEGTAGEEPVPVAAR